MLSDHRAYHLYRKETDMRKGFNLLCGIILNELGRQVTQGDAFIFINISEGYSLTGFTFRFPGTQQLVTATVGVILLFSYNGSRPCLTPLYAVTQRKTL
jgi:hypothetical protein